MSSPSKRAQARDARQQEIVVHVVSQGMATVAELTDLTGASPMTIHRDLDELARRGVVRKFHGGVSAQPSTVFEASSEYRLRVQTSAKEALAATALRFIEPGMSLMIDDSTTTLALAKMLNDASAGPLTVATNYLPAVDTLREFPDVRLMAIGGAYSATHDSFLGMATLEAISALSVDVVFVSTSAMTSRVAFHQEQELVQVKRAMMDAGERRVLLMDSSKLGRRALHRVAPVAHFHHVVVNDDADPQFLAELREETDVRTARPA